MPKQYFLKVPKKFREKKAVEANDLLEGMDERKIYSVSDLTEKIKDVLEPAFPLVWVEGELSDPKLYSSGHLWFDLKDESATLKSVMWRTVVGRLPFEPEHGLKVVVRGRIEFYAPRGEVKFIAESMEPKGMGALQLAFEQLCKRLEKEGLFDEKRKRVLPGFPQAIGVVTSPTGAAVEDVLRVLRDQVRVVLFPTRVQGEGAAEQIVRGIEVLSRRRDLDCLLIGRGGGSLEDLWAFNEEIVARAVAASRLPVISAVGHDKDTSISDLVADVRAATPTKGAELVAAQRRVALQRLLDLVSDPAFSEPETWLDGIKDRLSEASDGLMETMAGHLDTLTNRLKLTQTQLWGMSPQALLREHAQTLVHLKRQLLSGMEQALMRGWQQLIALSGQLHDRSPLVVLGRGYSITFDSAGRIVKRAKQVSSGAKIRTRLHDGELISTVNKTLEVTDGKGNK